MNSFKEKAFNEQQIYDTFGISQLHDIVEDIIDRIDEDNINSQEDLENEILQSIDNTLIYTDDQWTVIANYSSPDEPCNISTAIEMLYEDICNCIKEI